MINPEETITIKVDKLIEILLRHAYKHWRPGSANVEDLVREIQTATERAT